MAYLFGAGNTDRIALTGLTPFTTAFTIAARFKFTAADTSQRSLYLQQMFFDTNPVGTNEMRIGYQDGDTNFKIASWVSGFTADSEHLVFGTLDTALGTGEELQLFADTDTSPQANTGATVGPLGAATTGFIGGNGTTASAAATIYEVAYWTRRLNPTERLALETGGSLEGIVSHPTHYWPLISDATDIFGGAGSTVTGATVVAHSGTNWYAAAGAPTRKYGTLLGVG